MKRQRKSKRAPTRKKSKKARATAKRSKPKKKKNENELIDLNHSGFVDFKDLFDEDKEPVQEKSVEEFGDEDSLDEDSLDEDFLGEENSNAEDGLNEEPKPVRVNRRRRDAQNELLSDEQKRKAKFLAAEVARYTEIYDKVDKVGLENNPFFHKLQRISKMKGADGKTVQISNFSRFVKYENLTAFEFLHTLNRSPLLMPEFMNYRDIRSLASIGSVIGFDVLLNNVSKVGPKSTLPSEPSRMSLFKPLKGSLARFEKFRTEPTGTEIQFDTWESICLRFITTVYSNFFGITENIPSLTYEKYDNVALEKLTGYKRSLWEDLGKGTALMCLIDIKFVRNEVAEIVKTGTKKFTQKFRRAVKQSCREELKKKLSDRKFSKIRSDFTIIFPNLISSLNL